MNNTELKFIVSHTHAKGSVESEHTHPCHELVYYVRGEGTSVIGGASYRYRPGTFAYIPPSMPHSEVHDSKTEVMFFAFETENGFFTLEKGIYNDDGDNGGGSVLSTFFEIQREVLQKKRHYKFAAGLLIDQVLLRISRINSGSESENVLEENMKYALDYIKYNAQYAISVQSLADAVGYSYDYFRHQFRKLFGMNAKEYILKERIDKVKSYLANSDMSLAEISRSCSFESQAHMSYSFKKVTGETPAAFRKKSKKYTNAILVEYK